MAQIAPVAKHVEHSPDTLIVATAHLETHPGNSFSLSTVQKKAHACEIFKIPSAPAIALRSLALVH